MLLSTLKLETAYGSLHPDHKDCLRNHRIRQPARLWRRGRRQLARTATRRSPAEPASAQSAAGGIDHGNDGTRVRPGIATISGRILAAIQLIERFNGSGMASLVNLRSVQVDEPGVLVAFTDTGSRVTFGCEAFETQLLRWREIHMQSLRLNKSILTLDLAVRNNVPVRWVEAVGREPGQSTENIASRSRRGNV